MQAQLFLNKQPVLTKNQDLYGYHLSLEVVNDVAVADVEWDKVMRAFCDEVAEQDGMSALTANKPVFYRAPQEVIAMDWLPKMDDLSLLTVEVGIESLKNKQVLTTLKSLMQAGGKVAVDGFASGETYQKLLTVAKVVKLNVQEYSAAEVTKIVQELSAQNIKVVVQGIDSEDMFQDYAATGASWFQGYFFTHPVISGQKELSGNKLALLKLLAEVNDPDIEFEKVVETVRSDVGLTHKLLSAINHPSNKVPQVVETLKDAVNFMGLKRLKFWVNMMMLSEVSDVPKELLTTALVRAKFMEQLAEKQGHPEHKDRYFMTGMFSTLNAFLKASMVDIVDQLPLSNEIKLALVDQSGQMGKVLFVVRSLEQGNANMQHSGVDIMVVSSAYMAANAWANKTLKGLEAA